MPDDPTPPQANQTPTWKFRVGPKTEVVLTLDTLAKWAGVFFLAGSLVYTAREAVHADVRSLIQTESKGAFVSTKTFDETVGKVQGSIDEVQTSLSEIKGGNEERIRSMDRIERMVEQLALREGVNVPPRTPRTTRPH